MDIGYHMFKKVFAEIKEFCIDIGRGGCLSNAMEKSHAFELHASCTLYSIHKTTSILCLAIGNQLGLWPTKWANNVP